MIQPTNKQLEHVFEFCPYRGNNPKNHTLRDAARCLFCRTRALEVALIQGERKKAKAS